MNCPVCNAPEIEDDIAACPQCKSDLEIFRLLTDAGKQRQTHRRIIGVFALLFAVAAIGWAVSGSSSDEATGKNETPSELSPAASPGGETINATESEAVVASLKNENAQLKSEIGSLNEKVKTLNEKLSAKSSAENPGSVHVVKAGESLWKIAEKYFGDGEKYRKIAKDNGLSDPYLITEGLELKINK